MQLDTIPNFNMIKCSLEKAKYDGKIVENDIINLNFVFKVRKHSETYTGKQYDEPSIWFYHNMVSPSVRSYDIWWWHYDNSPEGFEIRNKDYERICLLCK